MIHRGMQNILVVVFSSVSSSCHNGNGKKLIVSKYGRRSSYFATSRSIFNSVDSSVQF